MAHGRALTCELGVAALVFIRMSGNRGIVWRRRRLFLQQTSLLPLLPFFEDDLRIIKHKSAHNGPAEK